ncbi:TIGR03899 family protein [Rheinheimera maricola]|uniref:TIGR03899 family protein n=1 Tax=Rheinheimera maricola TaxID=2793282 RepID=A0ABS7X969_9GAMM|nr:TIGR03899 family protein [Rheinheimera maricola]MBZ9611162.1 TIGR03899 family protein [Rheinheimera maricola]
MVKVTSLSGQQRLAQLARSQFGTAELNNASDSKTVGVTQGDFAAKHQSLSARSGATVSTSLTLTQRAERRIQMQRERQQYNLESIMALAMEYCTEQVANQDVDPDWFQQFCELVLEISNKNMQQLWAKILAGEIAAPGKFSLKTLHSLKRMSYKEALALQQAANLSFKTRQDPTPRIYFGYIRKPSLWRVLTGKNRAVLNLNQYGLSYPQILSLMDIGLLHNSEIESGSLPSGQILNWQYQQTSINGTINSKDVVLQYYKYTACGAELLPLLTTQPNLAYVLALKQLLAGIVLFGQ